MIKKFLSIIFCLVCTLLSGQSIVKKISISPLFSYTYYGGELRNRAPAILLNLGYDLSKRSSLFIGYEHGFKSNVNSHKSSPKEEFGDRWSSRLKVEKVSLSYNYHLLDKSKYKFNVYLLGGLGYSRPSVVDVNYSGYVPYPQSGEYVFDPPSYDNDRPIGMPQYSTFKSRVLSIDGGLGLAYAFNKVSLIAEFNSSVPLHREKLVGNVVLPAPTPIYECRCAFEVTNNFPASHSVRLGLKMNIL